MNTETRETFDRAYAKVVLLKGINIKNGQNILIKTSPATYDFARVIAQEAYETGAGYVKIEMDDYALLHTRLSVQDEQQRAYIPMFEKNMLNEFIAEDWAYIRIDNTEDRAALKGIEAAVLASYQQSLRDAYQVFRSYMMRHERAWCVICAPGENWARQILGEEASLDDLYGLLAPILRIDAKDPLQAWDDHAERIGEMTDRLTGLAIEHVHITDEVTKTDITIGLPKEALWMGGPKALPDGRRYFPNIPTEEVFTVPHRLTANGSINTTKPLTIFGSLVDGCSFTFEDGKVISSHAETGDEVLQQFLITDDGSRFMGELALVDSQTPIAQSGKIFSSILYDENAACHFALGAGYPSCLKHGHSLSSDAALREAGCNTSKLHTDFMFGSPTTRIQAFTRSGEAIMLMEDGKIQLD